MTVESKILARLTNVFRDVFGDKNLEINSDSNAETLEDWDSLRHISLITGIEAEFEIRIALGEITDLKNVGDMITLISRKID